MDPWYKVVTLRREVREGRSFSPDEFAIALEQIVTGTAPSDYSDPAQFFSRTCFTSALREHSGMVLRRLAGQTEHTAPVLTLITQFGGGKTHTLASLYHIARAGSNAAGFPGVANLLSEAGITAPATARVGVFVGNAWDPADGRETPWIDLARQIAGDRGVDALGTAARSTPPGTEALSRVFDAANGPVLLLFDEVLNFVNRHRGLAEHFHAFLQNLTVAVTGATHTAAVISLPRSQVEMTDWDQQWQERITKVVRRVARDLIANDESEISEVVRRRLFEDLGPGRVRRRVAKNYANWCFERSARLPAEWLAVDTATSETRARDSLRDRFEACYPFHPATLSVFQRKWRALAQFQQTRGALAMLAQWISWAAREHFSKARTEPLITLGSAPLDVPEFRAVVLGQLGEARLDAAIEADLAGSAARARPLDADATGALRDIHRRVGTAILFESSGGQADKVAHLPELRFALGEPHVDTTTIDNAAAALEDSSFFIRRSGTDGYRLHHQATLRKVVNDRRASLDEATEIRPAVRKLVEDEFKRGSTLPLSFFPPDSAAVQDAPRLGLIVLDPEEAWENGNQLMDRITRWTRERGASPRLYPGSLVWCARKPGRELHDKVELWLAWKRVAREVAEGMLGSEYDRADRAEIQTRVKESEDAVLDEIWAGYRYVAIADHQEADRLRTIDLGAGHGSASESLSARVISAMKSEGLLNESVGAGYIDRHWPPAFAETGAWPLNSLRQSFLSGRLTRLVDPDRTLRRKIAEFVGSGDFGLAYESRGSQDYDSVRYKEPISEDEVAFEDYVVLLRKSTAEAYKASGGQPTGSTGGTGVIDRPDAGSGGSDTGTDVGGSGTDGEGSGTDGEGSGSSGTDTTERQVTVRVNGDIPSNVWNVIGTRVLSQFRRHGEVKTGIDLSVSINAADAQKLATDLRRSLEDLGIDGQIVREEQSDLH